MKHMQDDVQIAFVDRGHISGARRRISANQQRFVWMTYGLPMSLVTREELEAMSLRIAVIYLRSYNTEAGLVLSDSRFSRTLLLRYCFLKRLCESIVRFLLKPKLTAFVKTSNCSTLYLGQV